MIDGRGLYLDECVAYPLLLPLRSHGLIAFAARDEGMLEASDDVQLEFATRHDLILVSHNAIDFRRLHNSWTEQGLGHGGIVLVPGSNPFDRVLIRILMMSAWIATLPESRSLIFPWGRLQEMLENGAGPPGFTPAEMDLALGRP